MPSNGIIPLGPILAYHCRRCDVLPMSKNIENIVYEYQSASIIFYEYTYCTVYYLQYRNLLLIHNLTKKHRCICITHCKKTQCVYCDRKVNKIGKPYNKTRHAL